MLDQIRFYAGLAVLAAWLIWFLWPALGPLFVRSFKWATTPIANGSAAAAPGVTVELTESLDPRTQAFQCVTFLHDHFSANKCDEGRKAIESALALLLRKAG